MAVKRGDIVVAAARGAFSGKPRPALVVQTDTLNPVHTSIIIAPITTEQRDFYPFRIKVDPTAANGLRHPSDIMLDKLFSVPRDNIAAVIGTLEREQLDDVNRSLLLVLGLV